MTSTYTISVDALTATDAPDIASRRARDDGYRVLAVIRVHAIGPQPSRRWSVELSVVKA